MAPHPFLQVRGSPIDVDNLVRALSARPRTRIDLLTYAEGEDRTHPGLSLYRIAALPSTRNLRPGFSLKKLMCDVQMFFRAWSLIRHHRYHVVHAVEETVFMALIFKRLYRIPYVYDLDSSLSQQLVESMAWLRPWSRALTYLEGLAVRHALATAPVCNALHDHCRALGATKIVTLHDISILEKPSRRRSSDLAHESGTDKIILLYAGNLEPYQGIDLLLEAFAIVTRRSDAIDLVVIGGVPVQLRKYRRMARDLGTAGRVHFLGPQPLENLGGYLADADMLTSPRIRGINTPMKVFSYMHSGRPLLATDLPTHTQILPPGVAALAPPEPEAFASEILRLANDPEERERIGRAGQAFVEVNHTFEAHQRRVDELYDWVEGRLASYGGLEEARTP